MVLMAITYIFAINRVIIGNGLLSNSVALFPNVLVYIFDLYYDDKAKSIVSFLAAATACNIIASALVGRFVSTTRRAALWAISYIVGSILFSAVFIYSFLVI